MGNKLWQILNTSEQKNLTSFLFFGYQKLLYGILLDRISLSKKNGWIDSDGYVYIIYTIAELQELL